MSHDGYRWLRWALLATLLATLLVAALSYQRGGMVVQGLVAGLGYGLSAVFVRVTMQLSGAGTSWLVIPELYLALLAGGCGVVMYARALEHQRGSEPICCQPYGKGTFTVAKSTVRSGPNAGGSGIRARQLKQSLTELRPVPLEGRSVI